MRRVGPKSGCCKNLEGVFRVSILIEFSVCEYWTSHNDRVLRLRLRLRPPLSPSSITELAEQNSGKASILSETTRVVKHMLDQIISIKKENRTLLSESQYVMVERNELEDEACAVQKQISELKNIIKETTVNVHVHVQTNLDLNAPAIESQEPPRYNPVFVIAVCHTQTDAGVVHDNNTPVSNVSKPYPKYPTVSDSWPLQLHEKPYRV
ncbi:hypothetical protein L2E82_19088 [Cichorium intybus]|uniref:Uncharacterized protein n=1 Tax=Cichorium intybus TaxID=13427 RepID=A0ACB9FC61_CICIN|nr:hypothetical protein L2E82_19088 [Cichorium intybus]